MGQLVQGALMTTIGTSKGLTELNEGRKMASNIIDKYRPTGFTSAGLTGTYTGDQYALTRGAPLTGAMTGLSRAFQGAGQDYRTLQRGFSSSMAGLTGKLAGIGSQYEMLRQQVSPAFGALTQAGLARLQSSREKAIGNLRENLSRRRVLGSSFAEDALSRAEAEYGMQEAQFAADAKLQEIMAQSGLLEKGQGTIAQQAQMDLANIQQSSELIGQANQAAIMDFQSQVQQLNLESGLAAQLSSGISDIMSKNTQLNAQLTAEFQALRAGLWANIQKSGLSQMESGASQADTMGGSMMMGMMSDRRLKTNIKKIGIATNGLPVYTFDYIWGEKGFGYMADEVKEKFPDAVLKHESGYDMVNLLAVN